MTENAPLAPGPGNTIPAPKHKEYASKKWVFTVNNYTDDCIKTLQKTFCSDGSKLCYGFEEAPTTGTPHLQGWVHLAKKLRKSQLRKILPNAHWEKQRAKNDEDAYDYCLKSGKYFSNFWIPKPVKLITDLHPWQKRIEEIIFTEPDDRTIHWFYEHKGKIGKTQLVKYLAKKYDCQFVDGAKKDILYICGNSPEKRAYLFNFSRSVENYVSYDSLEKLKDGLYTAGKYESKTIIRNSPHVIVFANFPPDESRLSQDRWHIVDIG